MRYALTESARFSARWITLTLTRRAPASNPNPNPHQARFCPLEDHNTDVANVAGWNWRNPFTAYNCTWGFHHPTAYPEPPPGAAAPCDLESGAGMHVVERDNSTTCAR